MAASEVMTASGVPEWTVREQLVLASAVQRSGDKNWVSVSRAIKPLMDDVHSTDYFSQKNCALQYAAMIDKVPNKRNKRASEDGVETTEQQILRELSERRIRELSGSLAEIRREYGTLSNDIELLEKGELDDKVPELWDKLMSESAEKLSPSKKKHEGTLNKTNVKAEQASSMTNPKLINTTKGSAPLIQQAGSVAQSGTKTEANVAPSTSLKDKITAIKKEPLLGTPTATESENPIVRLMDDKVLSPMQTPVPTSSGQPLSDNLHIILQERNKAVNFLSGNKSTEPKPILAISNSATTSTAVSPTTTKPSPLPPLTSPQFSSTPSTTVCTQQTTTVTPPVTPPAPVKQSPVSMTLLSPVKDSQISHPPKHSVPITAYLSKAPNVSQPSQPSKPSVLQSLVSAPSTSVPVTVTNTPTLTTSSPAKTSTSLSTTITHVTSPLATASVSAPLMQSSPVKDNTTAANLQATKPSIVTVQPVPTQVSASTTQQNLSAIAVSSPVKAAVSMASHQIPSKSASFSADTTAQKKSFSGLTMVSVLKSETSAPNSKSEPTKDIKTLLTLPPSNIKLSVKTGETVKTGKAVGTGEVSHPLKQSIEQKTPIKQEPPHTGQSDTPMKKNTTAVKTEPEIALAEAPHTPVSSPPYATSIPVVVMDTQDETEDDTPTRIKKGRSFLTRTLLSRSRKRKPEDEGLSVESTDTEEDCLSSQATSAVPSPAPSQCSEMDADTLKAHKQWKKGIMIVWRHAAQHKYANFFLHPVREEDAPGYKDIILSPTDLHSIKRRVESGHIKNDVEFQREMLLMFQNAFMYNSSDHEVYEIAHSMKSDVMENLQTYLATQAQLQLVEDPMPTKTLRGRRSDRDQSQEDNLFSPATKKRRTRTDDRD